MRRGMLIALVGLLGCAGVPPDAPRVVDGRLAPCPSSPNCVSSDAPPDDPHYVAPLRLLQPAPGAWRAVRAAVEDSLRVSIVGETPDALHAECVTPLMRYVDDLELQLRADEGLVAVRSASRVGYGDMGANRARVEALRARLAAGGVVAAAD